MKASNVIIVNIGITLLLLGGFYYAINTYGTEFLTGIWDKNGVTKIINQKVIQENVSEYRKLSDTQSDVTKAIASSAPSVLHIVKSADIGNTISGGIISSFQGGASAIALTSDGYLLTNKHVVSDLKAKYSAITSEGRKLTVSNIWLDPVLDLAVLKVTDNTGANLINTLHPASFVSADSTINLGQFAVIIGSSQTSTEFVNSFGSINQKNITSLSSGDSSTLLPYYGVDAAVYPGFSGGPTLDLQGNVIAITTAMNNGETHGGLILPVTKEMVQSMLTSIISSGKIIRVPFGITTLSLSPVISQQLGLKKFAGWYIEKIASNSLAAEGGLQKGDIILSINGNNVIDDIPLSRYWLGYTSGDKISLSVYRNTQTQQFSVTLH